MTMEKEQKVIDEAEAASYDTMKKNLMEHPDLEQFFQEKFETKVSILNKSLKEFLADLIIEKVSPSDIIDDLDLENVRCCSVCGKPMCEGFCIENGMAYYCSEECLKKEMTWEEYLELYDDGNGDSYWTSWL